ncbi:MAG: NAD(P)-dependent oxidoreductase [Ilumatobacteraceae bacterium]
MKIGCIGLGNIGRHLAANLMAAGFDVTVHDLHRSAAEPLLAAGAMWADSPAEVAASTDAVITCLPSVAVITRVVAGKGGLLEGFRSGSTWIDMSTNDRHELLRLAELLAANGVATLEAPVTGGAHNASSATITVLVGGDEAVYERHADVFSAVGGRVFFIGELGKAAVIKVITNMLAFIHIAATAEAYMLAARAGIDLRMAWEVIKASSGNSFIHETESTTILSGSYDIGFSLDLACKDLGFAMQLGRELDVPLDIAGTVDQLNIRARAAYGGSAGSPMVARLLETACGVDLRAAGFPADLEEYLATMPRAERPT